MVKSFEDLLQNNLNLFKQTLEKKIPIDQRTGKKFTVDYNTVNGKVLYSLINAVTATQYNNDRNAEYLFKQFFPQTADYNALKDFHGNTWGIIPYDATPATGYVIFTGSEGSSIQQGTQVSANGQDYSTNNTVIISKATIKVSSLVSSNKKATVILSQDFKTASGMTIAAIYGANESQYNKNNFKIATISTNSFTYDVEDGTPTTATGNIYVDIISASVLVTSSGTGESQNLINGTVLTMNVPKNGVDDECYVYYDGITGGKESETEEHFRERALERIRKIPQGWNTGNIILTIREFQYGKYTDALIFVPRAEKTNGEQESGFTTIYMLKKDLTVLSSTEAQDIVQYLSDTIYTANPAPGQLNVVSPTLKTVKINLSLINGANTIDMRKAIEETIKDMQNDQTVCFFRKKILKKTIEFWLDQVIDEDGNVLEDNYILNVPEEDIKLSYNEFPILQLEWKNK